MLTAERQLSALADPSRRAIFEALARQPLPVARLAERFPISRPAVSQHLRVLRRAKLVVRRREGTRNIYRANPEGIAALREYLDQLWSQSLRNFKALAESSYHRAGKEKP